MRSLTKLDAIFILLLFGSCNQGKQNSKNVELENYHSKMTSAVKHISVPIDRSPEVVYAYASRPENFPKWVEFVDSISKQGDSWIARTSLGEIKIEFVQPNDLGVIDHRVTLPDGTTVNNPMRVIANDRGCEFVFTLFWMPGRTEQQFNADAASVLKDLKHLKEIMEVGSP